jgi:hypothetical protein
MIRNGSPRLRLKDGQPMAALIRRRVELESPDQVLEEMRSAAQALFRRRDPKAIYVFLEQAYRIYRRIRKAKK